MMMYLNRDMDGGPFLVYFLPILGGQKVAVSDSLEGWCAAGNLGASRVWIRMDDRTDGRWDGWMESFISSGCSLQYMIIYMEVELWPNNVG
jgi:hypothetical protein